MCFNEHLKMIASCGSGPTAAALRRRQDYSLVRQQPCGGGSLTAAAAALGRQRQPCGGSLAAAAAAAALVGCGSLNKMVILGLNKFKLVEMHFDQKISKSLT